MLGNGMINRIRALFINRRGEAKGGGKHDLDELHLAAAALMVEAARLDDKIDGVERERIVALVRERFELSGEEADTLLAQAEVVATDAAELYRFTRTVRDRFDHDERVELIEMLWEVAFSDGTLHDLEASLLRRVAGLVYVSDRESGQARQRVRARLGIG
jgi:uncharacterized tellurite resistance protein B-like protein